MMASVPGTRRFARSRLGLALVGPCLTLALAGCRGVERSDTAIRVAVGPWLTFAPLHIAAYRGFFEAQGLDVELVSTNKGSHAVPLLLSGDLDVLATPISAGFFHAVAAGQRVRFVADKGWVDPDGCPFTALAGSRRVVERGALVARGGGPPRISVSKEGPLLLFVERALRLHGLALAEADVHHVPIAAEMLGLEAGTLDAAVMSDPQLSQARRDFGVDVLVGIQEVMPGYQFSMLAYGPRLLDRDPDLGRRFMVAYLQAVRAYGDGRTEDNLRALAAATHLTPEALADMCWMPIRGDGSVDLESLEIYRDWYVERGWLSSAPPIEDVWDPSFIEFANRALATAAATGK